MASMPTHPMVRQRDSGDDTKRHEPAAEGQGKQACADREGDEAASGARGEQAGDEEECGR